VFFILKGAKGKAEEIGTKGMLDKSKEGDYSEVFAVAAIVGGSAGLLTMLATPYLAAKAEAAGIAIDLAAQASALGSSEEEMMAASGPRLVAENLTHDEFHSLKKEKTILSKYEQKMENEKRRIAADKVKSNSELQKFAANPVIAAGDVVGKEESLDGPSHDAPLAPKSHNYVQDQLNADPHAVLALDEVVGAIHANVERHDARTEEMFKYVQVFTAIVAAFSHGANDVANAMGPFAAVWMTYKTSSVSQESAEVGDDMYWILAIGGVGICFGLATYGYKIMQAIGVKLTAITPARGYCIELGAAFVVIYGTTQGWPLSTTHCQVGATVGVGLFEGTAGVNKSVLLKTVFGWVITLVVAGATAAILVGPSPEPERDLFCDDESGDHFHF